MLAAKHSRPYTSKDKGTVAGAAAWKNVVRPLRLHIFRRHSSMGTLPFDAVQFNLKC